MMKRLYFFLFSLLLLASPGFAQNSSAQNPPQYADLKVPKEFLRASPVPAPQGLIIQLLNGSTPLGTWVSYGVIQCSTGMTCTMVGSNFVMTSQGGAANPGGTAGQVEINLAGTGFTGITVSGDCLLNTTTGAITCTKTGGTLFGALALAAWPGAGVVVSTGSAWGTPLAVGTAANNLVQLNGSGQLPAVSGALLTNLPSGIGYPLGTGIPAITTGTAWGTTYNASNPIPASFLPSPLNLGTQNSVVATITLNGSNTLSGTLNVNGAGGSYNTTTITGNYINVAGATGSVNTGFVNAAGYQVNGTNISSLYAPFADGIQTFTTTGTSGPATFSGGTLNIPQYAGGGASSAGSIYAIQHSSNGSGGFAADTPPALPGVYLEGYQPTTAAAVSPGPIQAGLLPRAITGSASTDSTLYSDVNSIVEHDIAGSAGVTETIPVPPTAVASGGLGNAKFAFKYCDHSGHGDTLAPAGSWTIQAGNNAAASTLSVAAGVCYLVSVDPYNATNWLADSGGGSGGVADTTVAVSSGTQGANSCSSASTATMTGLTTSMVVLPGYSADPTSLTGWGSSGGMVFQAWPSAANTVSYKLCNQSGSSISYSAITFNVGSK